MPSVNRVTLIGNVGRAPVVRSGPAGAAAARISLATTSRWKNRSTGASEEHTEWHKVVFYGRLADIVALRLKTGMSLYIEGRLRTRAWVDCDGAQRHVTEIVAFAMQMLGEGQPDHAHRNDASGSGGPDAQHAHLPAPETAEDEWVKAYDRQMAIETAALAAATKRLPP